MYLVELDSRTGQVKVDKEFDGIRAIKEFRTILDDPELGLECMTAIALTADHKTPIYYYTEHDRPYKAMEIATGGNRRAFDWARDEIQEALIKYDELQYNPTIEEKRTLDFMLLEKLKEIQKQRDNHEKYNGIPSATLDNFEEICQINKDVEALLGEKPWDHFSKKEQKNLVRRANSRIIEPYNERQKQRNLDRSEERMLTLFKQLETIKKLVENFEKVNGSKDIHAGSPVRNGYSLTRLEEKRHDANSFYHQH